MAKRRGRPPGSGNKGRATQVAETIGGALGTMAAKVDAWMAQREEIAHELRQMADQIMSGVNPFGQKVTTPSMIAKEVEAANAPVTATGKKRTMSADARARIAAAQRARWAKQKAAGGTAKKAKKTERP